MSGLLRTVFLAAIGVLFAASVFSQPVSPSMYQSMRWRMIGPFRRPDGRCIRHPVAAKCFLHGRQ